MLAATATQVALEAAAVAGGGVLCVGRVHLAAAAAAHHKMPANRWGT